MVKAKKSGPKRVLEQVADRTTSGLSDVLSTASRPLEAVSDSVVSLATSIHNSAYRSPVRTAYNGVRRVAPRLAERAVRGPFGQVKLPELALPEFLPLTLDSRRREAMKASVAMDLAELGGGLPLAGGILLPLLDSIQDTHREALQGKLTEEELTGFLRYNKAGPSFLAVVRTFETKEAGQ